MNDQFSGKRANLPQKMAVCVRLSVCACALFRPRSAASTRIIASAAIVATPQVATSIRKQRVYGHNERLDSSLDGRGESEREERGQRERKKKSEKEKDRDRCAQVQQRSFRKGARVFFPVSFCFGVRPGNFSGWRRKEKESGQVTERL